MNRIALLIVMTLAPCLPAAANSGASQTETDKLKLKRLLERVLKLEDDLKRMRERAIKLEIELLVERLKDAREAAAPDKEMELLRTALDVEFVEVVDVALRELERMAEVRRMAAVPDVLKRFGKGVEAYDVRALAFLGRVAHRDAVAAVLSAAKSPLPAIRRAAATALQTVPDVDADGALLVLLEDPDRDVRLAVLDTLSAAKRASAVTPLIAVLRKDTDPAILEKTADALGAIGSPKALNPLLELLERTRVKEVRWSCIHSLGKIGDPRAAVRLRPYAAGAHPLEVRRVTIGALGKIKDNQALPLLGEILAGATDEKLRQEAAAAITLMAPPNAIMETLLPAYLMDPSKAVRQTLWKGILKVAGEDFEALAGLTAALIERGRRTEADQVCLSRLHPLKTTADMQDRRLALEETVARAAYEASDFKAALAHYLQMAALRPDRPLVSLRIADCYGELKDFENAVKTRRALDERLEAGQVDWWDNRLAILDLLGRNADPEPVVVEAHALYFKNPPPHPEPRRKLLESAIAKGAEQIIQPLAGDDAEARKKALDAAKRQGVRIIGALASLLEQGEGARPAVVEAGNAITGSTLPLKTTDPAQRKEAAATWRAWLEANGAKKP